MPLIYPLPSLVSLNRRVGQFSRVPLHPLVPQAQALAWPDAAALMAARQAHGPSEWLKTWWRSWQSQPYRPVLLGALARHPVWVCRFKQDLRYFHSAQSHLVDRRWGMSQRIEALARDLSAADQVFGPGLAPRIASGEQVRLATLGDKLFVCLGLNDCSYHEGPWALSLRDDQGQRLYYLSLSFRSTRSVLVPTLQGPSDLAEDSRELVRRLTKQAEGLRPPALLMAALRAACAAWGMDHLAGIAPKHHVKGRWNLRRSRLRFDYQAFWQEQGGWPGADGHWTLPTTLPLRAAADTPANKRAMYRRRQALLARMGDAIDLTLSQREAGANLALPLVQPPAVRPAQSLAA